MKKVVEGGPELPYFLGTHNFQKYHFRNVIPERLYRGYGFRQINYKR